MNKKPVSRQPVCKHCGSYACANGGSNGSGYWISDPGCDAARADRGLPPWKNPLDSGPSADAADVSQAREQDQQTAQAAGSTQTGERGGA